VPLTLSERDFQKSDGFCPILLKGRILIFLYELVPIKHCECFVMMDYVGTVLHIVMDIYEKVGKSEFPLLMLYHLPELYSTLNGIIGSFELMKIA